MNEREDRVVVLVDEEGEGERIDRYLAGRVPELSRSRIQKLLRSGQVLLEGSQVRASRRVTAGQRVELDLPVCSEPLPADEGPLAMLYEDEDIIVLDKPPGLVVHPVREGERGTLANILRGSSAQLSSLGGVLRPGIVHRLDRDTSGVMVAAKTDFAHAELTAQMKARTVRKEYVALLLGCPEPPSGEVTVPVGRDPFRRERMAARMMGGKPAQTAYEVAEKLGRFSWVRLRPRTGQTHHIRVHMAYIGHPVAGDGVYGPRPAALAQGRFPGWDRTPGPLAPAVAGLLGRQALHAMRLGFTHPRSGRPCEFESPLPADLGQLLEAVRVHERQADEK